QKPSSYLLEQFILLAKGTSGSALTTLISQVLEAPGVCVFGELLELANVQDCMLSRIISFLTGNNPHLTQEPPK
uniref:COP9 signalosome subunit 7B n=1 Tax=Saimiri boliviensis boliviensis TaxID=39432 RepID=A0A2K6UP84_SAIBB